MRLQVRRRPGGQCPFGKRAGEVEAAGVAVRACQDFKGVGFVAALTVLQEKPQDLGAVGQRRLVIPRP
ncbi:hypothetical protein ABT127_31000 [Streptomyces sp. NPDC001904]|uniref:hypothetical protein n=1 Tax=Streptomyces sp. NPDC001904 TaxID=3154531 RepID=UPI0033197292